MTVYKLISVDFQGKVDKTKYNLISGFSQSFQVGWLFLLGCMVDFAIYSKELKEIITQQGNQLR